MKPKLITALGKQRMELLIQHLRTIKPEVFDFGVLRKDSKKKACGTVGCAVGQLPLIFPKLCRYKLMEDDGDKEYKFFDIVLKDEGIEGDYGDVASYVFEIPVRAASFLFTPTLQPSMAWSYNINLATCRTGSTNLEVADMLQNFLDQVDLAEKYEQVKELERI